MEAALALQSAHLAALEKLSQKEERQERKSRFQWALDGVKAEYTPLQLPEMILKAYTGNYGTR
ncbi:hypothetical protein ACFL27_15245 [candidate division CSSED10-310 bacterium]|uniref:Uncharacterized protein n=1 Tax=candidate division CSSED10-310 bacterium TaxID=2855610 RepID=A0ABV6YZD4_UNCC1